ncbi:LamG-like jellyroll fold domain-containing protein [Cryobacterium cryoconiti]|uniref:DNRLRE domain-containing protein n=1 Tax=Cryobacterium cryoconiti TaxID=1259239 RepID=A0A4Y8JWU9_9MICO|nr:LamG-like jellyroll fold domain-containing protein [Cryobacterium cryoconiti]TFD31728.1 DNRLRE domain-containing protein [Cryobacterium cryoconiti]
MRKSISVVAAVAVVAGMILAAPTALPASATSADVHFSADNLPTWQANGVVYAVAHSNGRVVAGGTFSQVRPPTGGAGEARNLNALAIFDAETGAPDNCQLPAALTGGTATIRAVVASPDGNTIYVGGNFSSIGGVNVNRIAAIDPVTCTVRPFRVSAVSSFVYGLAVTENTVYLAGAFTTVASAPRERFAAVNATTGALLPWVANAELAGRAVTVSPDRTKVALGGDFFTVNGADSHALAVVDAVTGANVRTYPVGFIHRNSVTRALASDDTAFYAGAEGTGGGVFDGALSIDWTTLDQRWRNTCLGATQAVLPYQGTLYQASHRHDCSSMNEFQDGLRYYFNASRTDNPTHLGWFPAANDGIGEGIGPRALTVAIGRTTGQTYLWSGGEFTSINGAAQQSLTRFGTTDSGAPPIAPVAAEALTSGAIQVRVRSVVDPDDSLLTYRIFRNNGATPVWTGTASSLWWTRPQITFVDNAVTPGTNYTYRVTVSDGVNTSGLSATASARAVAKPVDYAGQVIADGPKLYWRYDEATGVWAQDKSGDSTTGLNGLYENDVRRDTVGAIPGDASTAGQFDGSNDYVWSDQMKPAPGTYSIETWFKTNTTRGGKLVGYGNGRPRTNTGGIQTSSSYDRHVYMENSGRIRFGVYTGTTQTIRTATSYNDNAWHHLVATQGPNGMVLYVDGVAVGQNSIATAQTYYGTWRVGGDNLSSWPGAPSSRYFAGAIDDTAIYDFPLTHQQVVKHYSLAGGAVTVNETPADSYGAAVFTDGADMYWRLEETAGTVANDSSFLGQRDGAYGALVEKQQAGLVNGGSAVRATGSPLSVVASAQTGAPTSFSAEGWFRTGTTSGGKLIGFENTATGTGSSYDKQVYMTDNGSLIFGVYNNGYQTVQTPGSYNDNLWHHVVASQGPAGMTLHVDGVLTGTNVTSVNQAFAGYWRAGGGNLTAWPQRPSSDYFAGDLDEIAIYPRSLTGAQVASHYTLGVNDTEAPTVPQSVEAALVDGGAHVTWAASSDNIAVTGYRVHRGSAADFTVGDANKVYEGPTTEWTDPALGTGTYFYKVVAIDAVGNTSGPSEPAQVIVADTEAPSTPQGVSATASGGTVTLNWTTSSDNVAVTGYEVHRDASADFVAGPSTRIAETTSASYADSGLDVGTYHYRVLAMDAAGNLSEASASASATVAAAPVDPVVISVPVSEDAMVAQVNPNFAYGSSNQLSARGGTSAIESYLKFALPAAPAGMTLTGATLQVRTSTDSTAASTDAHTFRILLGEWSQGTVTWGNRPTGRGPDLGILTGATALNANYSVDLNAAELSGMTGTTVSFAMVSGGGDNVRLWSNEAPAAAARPLLTLTYTQ